MKFRLRPELDPMDTRMHSNVSNLNVFALINLKLFLKIKATPPTLLYFSIKMVYRKSLLPKLCCDIIVLCGEPCFGDSGDIEVLVFKQGQEIIKFVLKTPRIPQQTVYNIPF